MSPAANIAARSRSSRRSINRSLLLVLLVALALRLLLWGNIPRTGLISDEGEYLSAANWLALGRGFAWYQGYLWTRAPLYPLFLAAHLRLFGETLTPIFISQTTLSLVNVALVYALARRCFPPPPPQARALDDQQARFAGGLRAVPTLAALLMAIYFPFAIYPQVLLSETLYLTLLLAGFLALSGPPLARQASQAWAAAAGAQGPMMIAGLLFGLATLTRSLTLFFLPLLALWLLVRRGVRKGWPTALAFSLAAALVVLPWTAYNSRLYGGLVPVDTSGAFNLLLGARTAYDGRRSDAATRDFVLGLFPGASSAPVDSCAPYPGPLPSQAARQSAMTREGLCLMAARPLAFVAKSLSELIDLFQINYTGAERFTDGFTTGRLAPGYVLGLFLLDDSVYALVLPLAVLGWALARRQVSDQPAPALISLLGLWLVYNIAVAPLLFAINRFRLPLMPAALILAAYALMALPNSWRRLRTPGGLAWAALAATLLLVITTPYAYLWPQSQSLPSYLGPYPSSLADTAIALAARPGFLNAERLRAALQRQDVAESAALLAAGQLHFEARKLGPALLAAVQGHYDAGLEALPSAEQIIHAKEVAASIVRGDLLRSAGRLQEAHSAFGGSAATSFVDNANPVQWAWDWLRPAPARRIDLADDLDLGYVAGCYLGEYDPDLRITFRWCADGAQLRFPGAGRPVSQTLVLGIDRRGWPDDLRPAPPVSVLLGDQQLGVFTPSYDTIGQFAMPIPPTTPGRDLVVTLRMPTFVPPADRYLSQQGSQVGQVHHLGARIDWAELREGVP